MAFLQDALQQQLFGQGSLGRILVQAANDANNRLATAPKTSQAVLAKQLSE